MADGLTISRREALAAGVVVLGTASLVACGGSKDDSDTDVKSGEVLAELADIEVGSAVSVTAPSGEELIITRLTESNVIALSAICTHQGCTVSPKGEQLQCPCHGSIFEANTGEVVNGPATRPLPEIPVHVSDGQVISGNS